MAVVATEGQNGVTVVPRICPASPTRVGQALSHRRCRASIHNGDDGGGVVGVRGGGGTALQPCGGPRPTPPRPAPSLQSRCR